MKEAITTFESAQFGQIRTSISESGEPLFCLADLCKAIDIRNHRNVAKRIDEEGVRLMDIPTNGGEQQVLFVTEPGMYEVLLRSDSEKAKPFRKWVCTEVLPSIRKNGGYMVARPEETPEEIMARALMLAKSTIERQQATISSQSEQLKIQSKGVMIRQSGQWLLSAKYSGKGYTGTRTHAFTRSDGSQGTNCITVWTEQGRAFLHGFIS